MCTAIMVRRLKGQLIKERDSNAGTEICMSDDDIPLSEKRNNFIIIINKTVSSALRLLVYIEENLYE